MITHDELRHTLAEALSQLRFFSRPAALPGDLEDLGSLDAVQLRDLAGKVERQMRVVLDTRPADLFGMIQKSELPPDRFIQVHQALSRFVKRPTKELVEELETSGRLADGFYNHGAFPDGRGGYHIDDFGKKGFWQFEGRAGVVPSNCFVLRTLDAVALALDREEKTETAGLVVFQDRIDEAGGEAAVLPSRRTILVTPPFCRRSRGEQVAALRSALDAGGIAAFVRSDSESQLAVRDDRPRQTDLPDVWTVSVAAVRPNRAADYANHRFSYLVRTLTQSLRQKGVDAEFAVVEDDESFEHFIDLYTRRTADVVLFSLYQHRQEDIERIHRLAAGLRGINPKVFLVVEGPAAIQFKQFLAVLPEVNVLIRGEARGVLDELLALKWKGDGLSRWAMIELASRCPSGLFIRATVASPGGPVELGLISNADRSHLDRQPTLLNPERGLVAEWLVQRGCPQKCSFCGNTEGQIIKGRSVGADGMIAWMVARLALELLEATTPTALEHALTTQAASPDRLDSLFRLRPDSFIGRWERVSITLLGQNETANRTIILDWARRVRALGLHKYFRVKIADAAVASLGKERRSGGSKTTEVDRELLRALKAAGVEFIGMGVESLQSDILHDLRKGYTADLPIAVVKALLGAGFDPGGVRCNIIAATPDTTLEVAHASALLLYAAPLYNSVLFRFGAGWGNARTSRVYSHGGSAWSSIAVMRDPERIDFTDPKAARPLGGTVTVVRYGDYLVAPDAPEYPIQSEISPIPCVDERVPVLLTKFLYPTFYRHHVVQWFDEHMGDADVERAMEVLGNDNVSREVASFCRLYLQYREQLPELRLVHVIRHIKADMVALELFSFEDYRDVLARRPTLPLNFHDAGVTEAFEEGDATLVPGRFDPDLALACFSEAGSRAQRVLLQAGTDKTLEDAESRYVERRKEARRLAYRLMAYPDVQQFEFLGTVHPLDSDEALFRRVVDRMNAGKVHVAAAVESLTRDRLAPLDADEYGRLVKATKKATNLHLFAPAGWLRRLRDDGAVPDELRRLLAVERDPLVARLIRTNLDEFDRHAPQA
jgi:hypothetical protein